MITQLNEADTGACEKLLAGALRDIATELRLVDIGDLIAYVRANKLANIRDLVASSCEPYFHLGAWQFGDAADAETPWDAPARILLDLEFSHGGVTAFLRLTLSPANAAVEILGLHSAAESSSDKVGPPQLARALARAALNAS